MFWTVRGANAVIALRCCRLNGRFEDYRERDRVARSRLRLELLKAAGDVAKVWHEIQSDRNFQAEIKKEDQDDIALVAAASADPSGIKLVAAFKSI